MINKRKKNSRLRGSSSHGWGSKKKHRGAGNRGGKGNAGSGKRGDAKKPSYFGRKRKAKIGFTSKKQTKHNATNVINVEKRIKQYVEKGKAKKETDGYQIDLAKIKITKLLGRGKVTTKMNITVKEATESAIKIIKQAGGTVTVIEQKNNKVKQQE